MRTHVWVTVVLAAFAALAVNAGPTSWASTAAAAQECACKDLKTMQIELRNAMRFQEAYRKKIPELRTMSKQEALPAYKTWVENLIKKGVVGEEKIPGYKGPMHFSFETRGINNINLLTDPTDTRSNEQLCSLTKASAVNLTAVANASACQGIGAAVRAHEAEHSKICTDIGFRPHLAMHPADRAQEEVGAYGAQITVLRAAIAQAKRSCSYTPTKSDPFALSGVICSLERPFRINGTWSTPDLVLMATFDFVPSSETAGTWSVSLGRGNMRDVESVITPGSGGSYTIVGADTDSPRIVTVPQGEVTITGTVSIPDRPEEHFVNTQPISGETGREFQLAPISTDECNRP